MTKRSKTNVKPVQKMIYIGANLSGGRLPHGTVFSGGYPTHILALMDSAPWIANLFVPVERYTEKTKEAAQKGTALNVFLTRSREL